MDGPVTGPGRGESGKRTQKGDAPLPPAGRVRVGVRVPARVRVGPAVDDARGLPGLPTETRGGAAAWGEACSKAGDEGLPRAAAGDGPKRVP